MNTHVKKSEIKNAGRGVFAGCDIKKGTVVENCPCIYISSHEIEDISKTNFINYLFYFGKNLEKAFLALGNGSIYNHSSSPNSSFKISSINKTITFTAISDIKKDKEITFDYRNGKKIKSPLWFEGS